MFTKENLIVSALLLPTFLHAGEAGQLQREVWNNRPGASVLTEMAQGVFYTTPDSVSLLDGATHSAQGNSFTQRIRGYITAPETGAYTFWVAADDGCQFYLSSDASKFNKQLIAEVNGWTAPLQWDKYTSQQSVVIQLVAGQKYFIEVLHKDNGGPDNVALAWQTPTGEQEVIPSASLESYGIDSEDVNQNELPDTWEAQHNLVDGQNGVFDDPDQDGYINLEEYDFGTHPNQHGGVPGYLSYDRWNGVWGESVAYGSSILDLKSLPQYRTLPSQSEIIAAAEAPTNAGDKYGARLRGYVIAPTSGEYTFWVAGDDNVELHLSSDSSKFNKQRIAYHKGWTASQQWDKFSTQQSATITLVAGEKYYIEALVKEVAGGDNLAIAWQTPDSARGLIPTSALESYAYDITDADDDGLPASWELAHGLDPNDATGANGGLGDADGDFAPNWLEFEGQGDPAIKGSVKGGLVHELWRGIAGSKVKDLKASSKFLEEPDMRSIVVTGTGVFDSGFRPRQPRAWLPHCSSQRAIHLLG